MKRMDDFSDPFWQMVERHSDSECWPWKGFTKPNGHGLTSYKSSPIHASRKAWILVNGYPKSDLCVLHKCDYARCCNPSHLYLGTRADNMIDRFGNIPAAERAPRGRPTVLTEAQLEQLWKLRRDGMLLTECAKRFNVHVATICRYITIVRKAKLAKNRADRLSGFAK